MFRTVGNHSENHPDTVKSAKRFRGFTFTPMARSRMPCKLCDHELINDEYPCHLEADGPRNEDRSNTIIRTIFCVYVLSEKVVEVQNYICEQTFCVRSPLPTTFSCMSS